jgi:hypothetical protein
MWDSMSCSRSSMSTKSTRSHIMSIHSNFVDMLVICVHGVDMTMNMRDLIHDIEAANQTLKELRFEQ